MKKSISILFSYIFFCTPIFAQEYQISGTVENTEGIHIALANVLLLKARDSSIVKGTSTNEKGEFSMNRITAGSYLVSASYIANSSEYIAIEVLSDKIIGTLIIDETARSLDEVVVRYEKPKLERKTDRLVFNVANSTLSPLLIFKGN